MVLNNDERLDVLTICQPDILEFRLREVLEELGYDITAATGTDEAEGPAGDREFDLILLAIPTTGRDPREFLKILRWSGSPCRKSIIVGLSDPEHLEKAEELLDSGICRIINPRAPTYRLRQALEDVMRIDQRIPIHGFLRIPGAEIGQSGTIMTQTIDVSRSGMLVRFTKEVLIGARFSFSLTLPGMPASIEGSADIIRIKTVGVESIGGFAATFAHLEGDGQTRLDSYLVKQAKPKPGVK